jgi:broad specificity phosphatase PhoE
LLLDDIFLNNKGKAVALVTHGNFIKSLLTGILNADVLGFLSQDIFQSSLSKIVIDKDGYVRINFVNNIDHLPQPPEEDLYITLVD